MNIEQINFQTQSYIGIKRLISFDTMKDEAFYTEIYGKIMTYVKTNNVQITGAPVNIYFTWDVEKKETNMAVAMPVADNVDVNDTELEIRYKT